MNLGVLSSEQQEVLFQVSQIAQEALDLKSSLRKVLELVCNRFPTQGRVNELKGATLFLTQDAEINFALTCPEPVQGQTSLAHLLPRGVSELCCACQAALDQKQIQFIPATEAPSCFPAYGQEALCSVPLCTAQGQVLGLLQLYGLEADPLGHNQNFLSVLASVLAALIAQKQAEMKLACNERLLQAVNRVQQAYQQKSGQHFFETMLTEILALTESEYGFIGRILEAENGEKYLCTYALSDISWNQETRQLFRERQDKGFEFRNLETLFGTVIRTGEAVIANQAERDPRAGGLPTGHPPLDRFLGIPFYYQGQLVGMAGLANRLEAYSERLLTEIHPFIQTCSVLLELYNQSLRQQENEQLRQRMLENLSNSELNLQALLDNSSEAIWSVDSENRLWSFNRAFTELCHDFSGTVVSGLELDIVLPQSFRNKWSHLFQRALQGEHFSESLTLSKARAQREVELSVSPVFQQDTVIGVTAYAKDVSTLMASIRELSQKNAELNTLISCRPDLYLRLDLRGEILDCQGAVVEHRYLASEFKGKYLLEVLPFELAVQFTEKLRNVLREQQQQSLEYVYYEQGQESHFEASFLPLLDRQVVIAVRNTTAQKIFEQELIQARNKAEQVSEIKSLFLAKMSHELRTPLNSIIGFTRLILRKFSAEINTNILDYLHKVNRNGMHLLGIINDILDLTQIEEGKTILLYEEVNLSALLEDVVQTFEPELKTKGLKLTFDLPAEEVLLHSDALRLKQILLNIVGNAVKYTAQGGIQIRLQELSGERPIWQIEVEDTGPGIPLDKQAKIFEPFEQGDNSLARKYGGIGLGISICKSLSDLLGYYLYLKHSSVAGTCFALEIPSS